MEASKPQASPPLMRVLTGVEAGVIGGLAMLAVLVAASLLRRHVWWETPNLLGSTFYGSLAFRAGPSLVTIAGGAFHVVITGVVGGLFGLACGTVRPRRRLVLLGMLAGVVWYYLGNAVFWQRVNPLVPLYSSHTANILSHALFGACLGYVVQKPVAAEPGTEFPAPNPPPEAGPVGPQDAVE